MANYDCDNDTWNTKTINVANALSGTGITNDDVPNNYAVQTYVEDYAKPKDDIVLHLTLSDSSSSYDITPNSRLYT